MNKKSRRRFLGESISTAAGLASFAMPSSLLADNLDAPAIITNPAAASVRFSVIGINHGHIHGQIEAAIRGGGVMHSFYAKEPDLAAAFQKRYPEVKMARNEDEILQDKSVQLVLSAAIPADRAPLGIRVMKSGKDYMVDKPGIITLEQLAEVRKVQAETKRIYSIMYSERLENKATIKAGELIASGAIGKVIQTIGLGPHRMNAKSRPSWFFERDKFGGIICDIGSHQFDQFLFFTGSTEANIVSSQTGNVNHPQYPQFEDFGDVMLRGNGGTGYIRVDWFTPDGLNTWGDGRLTVLGTEGFMELRKYTDLGGRAGGNHLFVVDSRETRYVDCSQVELPYGKQLISDVVNRTETAMSQAHCFLATELALKAQHQAYTLQLKK